MDKQHYEEMLENLEHFMKQNDLKHTQVYLFGHCNATEVLADELLKHEVSIQAILDNNASKHGTYYKTIPIVSPSKLMEKDTSHVVVFIVARAYASMVKQLRQFGFTGEVEKLVDYNSYAEYSLSPKTIHAKYKRMLRGATHLEQLKQEYKTHFFIFCPFSALGDVYYMMSYLPYFLADRRVKQAVVFTIGNACADVVRMFGGVGSKILTQKQMDETIQAVLYLKDTRSYISHQDRPYVIHLYKALYIKKISFEIIYRCGVFGLPIDTQPYKPSCLSIYKKLDAIPYKHAVILSPHAKSVTNISIE